MDYFAHKAHDYSKAPKKSSASCEVYKATPTLTKIDQRHFISYNWSMETHADSGAMSAVPIYLEFIALAGAYLIHDSFDALFTNKTDILKSKSHQFLNINY